MCPQKSNDGSERGGNSRDSNAHEGHSHDNAHEGQGPKSGGGGGSPEAEGSRSSDRAIHGSLVFTVDLSSLKSESTSKPTGESLHDSDFLSRFSQSDHLAISRDFAKEIATSYDRITGFGPLNNRSDQRLTEVWRSVDEQRLSAWNVWEMLTEHANTDYHLLSRGGNGQRNDWAGLEIAWTARQQAASRPGQGSYKYSGAGGRCNVFRADVAATVGLYTPAINGRPITTGEWSAAGSQAGIRCYTATATPHPGSVYNFNDLTASLGRTHHTGYVTDPVNRQAVAAGSTKISEYTSWSTDQDSKERYIERHSDEQNMNGRAEIHFYDYSCPDHLPFERPRKF